MAQGLAPEITRFQVLDNSLNGIGSGTQHFSEAHIISIDVLVLSNFDRPLGREIGERFTSALWRPLPQGVGTKSTLRNRALSHCKLSYNRLLYVRDQGV